MALISSVKSVGTGCNGSKCQKPCQVSPVLVGINTRLGMTDSSPYWGDSGNSSRVLSMTYLENTLTSVAVVFPAFHILKQNPIFRAGAPTIVATRLGASGAGS